MRLTASRAGLASRCAFPFSDEKIPDTSVSSREGGAGTAFHAAVSGDFGPLAGLSEALQRDVSAKLKAWDASPWAAFAWKHETKYAYDAATDTARVLTATGARDYSERRDGEYAGSDDLSLVDGDRVIVADLKSGGMGDGVPASEHPQLRWLALAAARAYRVSTATVYLLDVSETGVHADEHTYGALDLAESADWFAALVASLPGAQPTPGAWCANCPVALSCPVATAQALAIAARGTTPVTFVPTPANRTALFETTMRVENWREQQRAALAVDAMANGPIALSDGREARRIVGARGETWTYGKARLRVVQAVGE